MERAEVREKKAGSSAGDTLSAYEEAYEEDAPHRGEALNEAWTASV